MSEPELPPDPFGSDAAAQLRSGKLLWETLLELEYWNEFKNAFSALTETDVRLMLWHCYEVERQRRRAEREVGSDPAGSAP